MPSHRAILLQAIAALASLPSSHGQISGVSEWNVTIRCWNGQMQTATAVWSMKKVSGVHMKVKQDPAGKKSGVSLHSGPKPWLQKDLFRHAVFVEVV